MYYGTYCPITVRLFHRYAIMNDKTPTEVDYYLQHEGVHVLTWDTKEHVRPHCSLSGTYKYCVLMALVTHSLRLHSLARRRKVPLLFSYKPIRLAALASKTTLTRSPPSTPSSIALLPGVWRVRQTPLCAFKAGLSRLHSLRKGTFRDLKHHSTGSCMGCVGLTLDINCCRDA